MKITPRLAAALALASCIAAPRALAADSSAPNPYNMGTTANGKTIVAPNAMGPFLPNTCVAGYGGCVPGRAGGTGSLGGVSAGFMAGMPMTESAFTAMSNDAAKNSLMQIEDKALKDGTFKSIDRDPSYGGQFAVITLANGKLFLEDYVRQVSYEPTDAAGLARQFAEMANNPNSTPEMRAAAKAAGDKLAYKQADCKMSPSASGCKKDQPATGDGDVTIMSDPGDPQDDPKTPGPSGSGDGTPEGLGGDIGGILRDNLGPEGGSRGGPGGEGEKSTGAGSLPPGEADRINDEIMKAGSEPERLTLTYDRLRRFAETGSALQDLKRAKRAGGIEAGDATKGADIQKLDKLGRGTAAFGLGGER